MIQTFLPEPMKKLTRLNNLNKCDDMARKQTTEDHYFEKYLDENFKDIKADIKEVKDEVNQVKNHVKRTNDRVGKLEDKVFPKPKETVGQLPPIWRDPQIIKLVTYFVIFGIILAVIYAGLKGFSLPKGIF